MSEISKRTVGPGWSERWGVGRLAPALGPEEANGTSFQYRWKTMKMGYITCLDPLVLIFQMKSSRERVPLERNDDHLRAV